MAHEKNALFSAVGGEKIVPVAVAKATNSPQRLNEKQAGYHKPSENEKRHVLERPARFTNLRNDLAKSPGPEHDKHRAGRDAEAESNAAG